MTWERIFELSDESLCRFFVRHAMAHRRRWWVEYVYENIEGGRVLVPDQLREKVAGTLLRLRLSNAFNGRKHVWIVYETSDTGEKGVIKLEMCEPA